MGFALLVEQILVYTAFLEMQRCFVFGIPGDSDFRVKEVYCIVIDLLCDEESSRAA